jgi:hypothetical protein
MAILLKEMLFASLQVLLKQIVLKTFDNFLGLFHKQLKCSDIHPAVSEFQIIKKLQLEQYFVVIQI